MIDPRSESLGLHDFRVFRGCAVSYIYPCRDDDDDAQNRQRGIREPLLYVRVHGHVVGARVPVNQRQRARLCSELIRYPLHAALRQSWDYDMQV